MMEQLPENSAVQGDNSAAIAATSLGRMLREARERLGLSVADAAGQIKFAPRQIEALEADDFQRLPEMPFVRGFVRSYARILHLDAEPLLALLPQSGAAPAGLIPASVEVPFPVAYSAQQQNLIWLGAALLLAVVVVAFAVWHFTTPQNREETLPVVTPLSLPAEIQVIAASPVAETAVIASSVPAAAPQPDPTETAKDAAPAAKPITPPVAAQIPPAKPVTSPAAVQATPAKPVAQPATAAQTSALKLVFEHESWSEIRDKDGNMLSSQINPAGSELRLDGSAPFSVVIGHAASVRLYHRGKQVDLTPYINTYSEVARLTLE